MKKAKFALTVLITFSIIGGTLAFKANRQLRAFYSLGTTTIGGEQINGCVVTQLLYLTPNPGGFYTSYSSTVNYPTTLCTAVVLING